MRKSRVFAVLAALSATGVAQQLQFEVASIKPSDPNERRAGFQMAPGGTVKMMGVSLRMLIAQAYDVRDFQISGGPAWMNNDRYDITAKPPDGTSSLPADPAKATDEQRKTLREQMQLRLQALLADRFQLKLHHDTKELPVYALVVAKNGPKLKESDATSSGPRGMMRMSPGNVTGQGMGIAQFAQLLSQRLQRPVIDQTGLKGTYDFELNFTPEQGQGGFGPGGPGGPGDGPGPVAAAGPAGPGGPPPGAPPGFKPPPPIDPNGPTIFTAIQDQLGLKLESKKGPVDTLVIDHAEKPSEN